MRRLGIPTLVIATTLLMGGSMPTPLQRPNLQHELDELTKHGLTYRFIDETTIEIKEEWSGLLHLKTVEEPSDAEIYAWADTKGIPTLEIDPSGIDTSQFAGMYDYWIEVPLSNTLGIPLIAGDVDSNSKPEIYGIYKEFGMSDYLARVYEIDSSGQVTLRHTYDPYPGASQHFLDADGDGMCETLWLYGGTVRDFEQANPTSLATAPNFSYQYLEAGSPGYTGNFISSLDADSLTDFLYKTTWIDSVDTNVIHLGTAVAEFNGGLNNFQRVWERDHYAQDTIPADYGGYAIGDWDGDGRKEFVVSFTFGNIVVFENTTDNRYERVWQDSIPFVNLVYGTSGDVDGDGSPEFFRGATMYNGNWTVVYEADSNNHYSPTFLFHLLTSGTFDEPTYSTSDIDGDGAVELIILSGSHLLVIKSEIDDSYYLWYYRRVLNRASVATYDFHGAGQESLILSKLIPDSSFMHLRLAADIYIPGSALSVKEPDDMLPTRVQLFQNYPNPFNPSATIEYSLPTRQHITLKVFDVLGREIAKLVDNVKEPGRHVTTWDGNEFGSGVYFYRLETESGSSTRKMLLVR